MKAIEEIIRMNDREDYYHYYLSLGYTHQTSAVLALFTYGQYSYSDLSMDDLYKTLCRGEAYLPPEELEKQKRWAGNGLLAMEDESCYEPETAPAPVMKRSTPAPAAGKSTPSSSIRGSMPAPVMEKSTPLSAMRRSMSAPVMEKSTPLSAMRRSMSASVMKKSAPLSAMGRSAAAPKASQKRSFGILSSVLPGRSAARRSSDLQSLADDEGFSTDEYEVIEEKDARSVVAEAASTFRMTTNTASAGIVLNQLRNGRRIDRSMVRIEEMMNYFRYDSILPEKDMFRISYELMDTDEDRKYLYINVQGREEVRDRQNIIILLDVSGSMSGNAMQTQAIIATILSKLGNGDKVSLVTYSTDDSIELEAFTINGPDDRIRFLEKLLSIEINGCTYGSIGIESAYRIGKKHYIKDGNNQVILITDGDLNFGITDKGGLEELIERKKKDHLFLSVIGTGLYNYKDDKLETLSKHGNGVYRTVNSLTDVKKSINEEYASLVNIIARDVKAQVEFNPEVVESYRLLGFENRSLAREDFTNDKVISEPFGSGGYGTALYELKMRTGTVPVESGLKYSRLITTGSKEPGTIRIRYKEPLEEVSLELEKVIETADASFTDNLRLAFIVYVCAEKLRGSDKISAKETDLARRMYKELGTAIREKNAADLYKLGGILEKSAKELGIGIPEDPFLW